MTQDKDSFKGSLPPNTGVSDGHVSKPLVSRLDCARVEASPEDHTNGHGSRHNETWNSAGREEIHEALGLLTPSSPEVVGQE